MLQGVLTLLLAALVEAAPMQAQTEDVMGYRIGGGVVGFIVLVIDIIVWYEVLTSSRPVPNKLLWCLLVFIFPILGAIFYFLFSNRKAHRRGYEVIP